MNPWKRKVEIGDAVLYEGDCADLLANGVRGDLLLTDPPYGINYGGMLRGKGDGNGGADRNGWKSYGAPKWDESPPDLRVFNLMLQATEHQIIWGGNYFTDKLRPSMRWLVWDKGQRDFSLADCEFAWTSQNKAARLFTFPRARALQDGKNHPTQKPVALMEWCLSFFPESHTVIDCYMGVGTTGVACAKLGRKFIGIELDPHYFDIACERIQKAYDQPDLLIHYKPETPKQEVLFDDEA